MNNSVSLCLWWEIVSDQNWCWVRVTKDGRRIYKSVLHLFSNPVLYCIFINVQCMLWFMKYSHTCLYMTFQGNIEICHLQQVVPKYRFNWYEMHCEGKLKIRPHNLIWGLIEVVTKVGLTVKSCFNSRMVKTGSTMLL